MLKFTFIAAALCFGSAGVTAASAQDMRAQYDSGAYGHNNNYGAYNDGGLGRYCPPGQYPHSWPNGGWRCQYANGDFSGAGNW